MVESLQAMKISQARAEPIYLWMITDRDYSELRKIEGCEDLSDLGATKTDAVHIMNFAKGLGIPNDRIFRNDAPTMDDMKATYKKILTLTRELSVKENQEHTIIVYAGGHGASLRE